ncbi:MAG: hypothetical protein HYS64_07810, partial [Rhodospirillales bacterium]|nr:hypothetical protein [Rhodospirillales bacterium]
MLTLAFTAIAGRLVDLTVFKAGGEPRLARIDPSPLAPAGRADVVDRNGVILATSLPTASLYADPAKVLNAEEAVERLVELLPDLDHEELLGRLQTPSRFQWVARNLTPKQQYEVNRLGLPGFGFQRGERRVYPHGRLVAHVIGLTDVDGRGIAGIERYFDQTLRAGERLKLAVDVRIQALMHEELAAAVEEFSAIGAAGLMLDADTGEVVAMVSMPDFDPNEPSLVGGEPAFNRATKGVYEMGSTFKLFTAAMALDSGTVTMKSGYDASRPIQISRFVIRDYHAKNRWLSVPEIVVYSSNIQHRRRQDGRRRGHEGTTNLPGPVWVADADGHRTSRSGSAADAGAVARDQYYDRRLRPRHRGDANADGKRSCDAGQRRTFRAADALEAYRPSAGGGHAGAHARDVGPDAQADAARGQQRHRPQGRHFGRRLRHRRQDRHRRQAGRTRLPEEG